MQESTKFKLVEIVQDGLHMLDVMLYEFTLDPVDDDGAKLKELTDIVETIRDDVRLLIRTIVRIESEENPSAL